jgi:hypothetical protein
MSQSQSAIARNAEAASAVPPPVGKTKTFTLSQEQLVREFTDKFAITREQVSFEGSGLDPIFDYDALSLLALELTDIPSIRVEPGDFNPMVGLATAMCMVTLVDGRKRETYGHAMVGEVLYDGSSIADMGEALTMVRSRALRSGLRMVGFDPVKALRATQKDTAKPAEFIDLRNRQLARAHVLGEELGYIVGENKVAWKNQIATYFRGKTSSADLDDLQLSQWVAMLEGWCSARGRALSSSLTEQIKDAVNS